MNDATPAATDKIVRQSNFEMLRMVSMVFIILFHMWGHVSYPFDSLTSVNSIAVTSFSFLGKTGVDIFVLISGYFLVTSRGYSHRKGLRLWLQILFYSVLCLALWCLVWGNEPTEKDVLRMLMPLSREVWWFATAYFVMFLAHPLLNRLIHVMDRETHLKVIVVSLLLWTVIPALINHYAFFYSMIPWFFTLYFVASYLRLYPEKYSGGPSRYAIYTALCAAAIVGLSVFYCFNPSDSEQALRFRELWHEMCSPLVVAFSLSLFLMFMNMDLGRRRSVNTLASAMFGVYLLHEWNGGFFWNGIWHMADHCNEPVFILHVLTALVVTFAVCSAIDLMRQYLLEKPLRKHIDGLGDRIGSLTGRFFGWMAERF